MRGGRGLRRMLAGVLVAALALGGCGIPDETDVERLAPGPSQGQSSGSDSERSKPTREEAADDTTALVENYLEAAAAGDPDSSIEQVRSFLSPSAAIPFAKVPATIKIIHLVEDPLVNPGSDEVTLQARTVGLLTPDGTMEASPDSGVQTYKLTVARITGKDGLFVTKAPQVLLLTDQALTSYYDQRIIYFWNKDHTSLVPDVRWMSVEVPREQVPQQVINWLIDGPSAWLENAVEPLPEGTQLIGNVPAVTEEGKLQINLSNQALDPADGETPADAMERLRQQLQWSLRKQLPQVLELKIGNQEQRDYSSGTDYLDSNASYRVAATPERFIVYNGEVRRLDLSAGSTEPVPVLRAEDNRNVRSAAIARGVGDHGYVALVVTEKGSPVLRVGSAAPGESANLHSVPLPGDPSAPPVWALTSDDAQTGELGMLIVGGKLYSFSAEGQALREIKWTGPAGPITSVAVAPDGRRVALVVGGKLYVAALTAEGDEPELTSPRFTEVVDLATVTAVDWGTETAVVVAGTRSDRNRVAILATEIDGSLRTEILSDLGTTPVTYLTSYPVSPTTGKYVPDITEYMSNGAAFDVLSGPETIETDDLTGDVQNPPPGVRPVNPFFLR
ncbi:LpqB family beta-propeller domain-containing protein [Symbioplanes lichenis]|uniref:LpqB family beta-propeller domain-containing protein n=1 Tax=Symbioplanes lichenis TaxID=1629072 RepID=UPI0027390302|nr:LpqB family beta-propeller domain-containing protein [Actinoplanes lichenis]